jgi:hypothetical protein
MSIKCAETHCNKTVHAENTFCLNHALQTPHTCECGNPAMTESHHCATCLRVWRDLQGDPDMPAPAPVLPPRSIWSGITIAMKTPESEGE